MSANTDIRRLLRAVLILDFDGQRLAGRCFDEKTNDKAFVRKMFAKTKSHRAKDDLLTLDSLLVLHRICTDIHVYVIGGRNENPVILDEVLNCLVNVLGGLMPKGVERQPLLDRMAEVVMAIDEMCDGGIILEIDSDVILQRICPKADAADQSIAQKLHSATEHIKFPWIRS